MSDHGAATIKDWLRDLIDTAKSGTDLPALPSRSSFPIDSTRPEKNGGENPPFFVAGAEPAVSRA